MGVKVVLRALFPGICAYRRMSFSSCRSRVLDGYRDGSSHGGIILIYVISCMAGGFLAGKIARREKYRWGALSGLAYFLLLVTVSFIVSRSWDMSVQHMITTFCMCLGGGTLGGMLS